MSEVSAKSFLNLLRKSGLCDADELKASIGELFAKAGGRSVNLDQLTAHLLRSGMLTEWHVQKLLSGKYKGYFLGKYKLLGHLGTGGMSTVYLAQHTIFNQQRAIKVLPRDRIADRSYLERFYREGRASAALNHRNIVRVYDIDHEADTHYLVMEYVRGMDINQMVKQQGALNYDQAIDYTIQALTGLQHAHENDLVHRDIKPANLLVTPDGEVKILDLGLALFQEEDTSLTVMHNERVLGTADYLSPEQAVDSHRVDRRSDIYSMGCTLYFMLTAKPPFPEGTIAQRIAMHQSREPQDIRELRPDCPRDLLAVVHKMMRKRPGERYQNCESLIADLRAVADSLLVGVPQIKTEPRTAKPAPSRSEPEKKKDTPKSGVTRPAKPSPETTAKQKLPPIRKASKSPVARKTSPQKPASAKQPAASADRPGSPLERQASSTNPRTSQKTPTAAGGTRTGAATVTESTGKPPRQPALATDKTIISAAPNGPTPTKTPPPESRVAAAVGSQPMVDPADVSVVVSEETAKTNSVDVQELRSFVAQNRSTVKPSVKPPRRPLKEQLLLAGLVTGMLLLLGIVLWMALQFAS